MNPPVPGQVPVTRHESDPQCREVSPTNRDLISINTTTTAGACRSACYNNSQCWSFLHFSSSQFCFLSTSCLYKVENCSTCVQEMKPPIHDSKPLKGCVVLKQFLLKVSRASLFQNSSRLISWRWKTLTCGLLVRFSHP